MKNYILLLLAIVVCSCQQKQNTNEDTEAKVPQTNSIINVKDTTNLQVGDTIYLKNSNKNGDFTAESSLDSINSKVYLKLENVANSKLKAEIIPTLGKGNIRFNQIIYPNKTADGPYGYNLELELNQKGSYIFVIGRSLMADAPFVGKFKVKISVTE